MYAYTHSSSSPGRTRGAAQKVGQHRQLTKEGASSSQTRTTGAVQQAGQGEESKRIDVGRSTLTGAHVSHAGGCLEGPRYHMSNGL